MQLIYNYLNKLWNDLKIENSFQGNYFFGFLFFITIPLPLAFNNIALVLWTIFSVLSLRKKTVYINGYLHIPILLFLWMAGSFFWSIDPDVTAKAILKEIVLLIVPLNFMCYSKEILASKVTTWLKYYSHFMVFYALFFLLRAVLRYALLQESSFFYYHGENNVDSGLVPKLLNAIHVSVFIAVAFFWFLHQPKKTKTTLIALGILFLFLVLLSSKNILLITVLLTLFYIFYFSKTANKMRLRNSIIFVIIILTTLFYGRIKQRFDVEFQSNTSKSLSHDVINQAPQGVHFVSIYEAWNNKRFTPNDYFPGTAFRVYQIRIFLELIKEEPVFFTGFGLNASFKKLEEKAIAYNLYQGTGKEDGYQNKNFHNQYVQNFAELGLIGFVLLLSLLGIMLCKSIGKENFLQLSFTILMISVFFTESFLWRQRGVAFFTFIFCLLITIKTPVKALKES
ncbi:MAG: hypothetical protein RLY43_1519 [Bacteroidota bacterium]|jgi:hypothetical protein